MSLVAKDNETLPVSETYRLVYPYKRFDLEEQGSIASIAERLQAIKEEIEAYSMFDSFDAVLYALRYLQNNSLLNLSSAKFVDCMSFCGAASFYATAFNVKEVWGIEFYKHAYAKALEVRDTLYPQLQSLSDLHFESGSFQDFFQFDADVVYLDCTQVGPDFMIEEGVLLHTLFFPLCKKLLSGSYIVVVTSQMTLLTEDCAQLGLPYECITHKLVDLQNENFDAEYKRRYPRHAWILRTSNYKRK